VQSGFLCAARDRDQNDDTVIMTGSALLETIRARLGDRLSTSQSVREQHAKGEDWLPPHLPDAVAFPTSTAEVAWLLAEAAANGVPVVPFGAGTSLEGHVTPVAGGLSLDLSRMTRIIAVSQPDLDCRIEAGVTRRQLNAAVRSDGLFFPVDPGADCTIGGMCATRASGTNAVRYGTIRENVLGLTVVLADGRILRTGGRARKSAAGYDLTRLFIGSEGTLGVITRAVLRLHPQPRSTCTALCAVAGYDGVLELLRHVRSGLGSTLSAFEMMWPDFYGLVTRRVAGLAAPLPHGHGAYVLVESMGSDPAHDQAHFEQVLGEALEAGVVADAVIAQSGDETRALWRVRDASGELRRVFWPHTGFDVSIAAGQIGAFVEDCCDRLRRRWPGLETVFFGHVGDANIHIGVRIGEGEQPVAQIEELVYGCVGDWRGSISAEHGIGTLKRAHLHLSRSKNELAIMGLLKRALDPQGILNPGKVFAGT